MIELSYRVSQFAIHFSEYAILNFSSKKAKVAIRTSGDFLYTIKYTKLHQTFTGFFFTNKWYKWYVLSYVAKFIRCAIVELFSNKLKCAIFYV